MNEVSHSKTQIGAADSMFLIHAEGAFPEQMKLPPLGGLLAVAEDSRGAYVFTGVDTGRVQVDIAVFDAEPGIDDDAGWEDIAWVTLDDVDGNLYAVGPYGDGLSVNFSPGRGKTRVRVFARGRDSDFGGFTEGNAVESYRIESWPSPNDEQAFGVAKSSSQASADLAAAYSGE